jgi:hypothetical protein
MYMTDQSELLFIQYEYSWVNIKLYDFSYTYLIFCQVYYW